jgi:hypothetical protein
MSNMDFEFSPITQLDRGEIQARGFGMVNLGATDDQQLVVFRWESIRNPAKSREAGRPIYERQMYVTIQPPGERLNIIDRPVLESDKHRWPRQWNAFITNRAFVPEGTPIAQLFPANPEVSDMLRGLGIHTVELCAKMTPHAIDSVGMGAQDWVNHARRYLDTAKNGVDYHKIEAIEEQHKHENNALRNQIADLTMRLNAMQQNMVEAMQPPAQGQPPSGPVRRAGFVQPAELKLVPEGPEPPPEVWVAPPEGFVSEEAMNEAAPVKRGPGRPPKNPKTE